MIEYESVIIVNSKLNKSEIELLTTKVEGKINEYGKVTNIEDLRYKKIGLWGKK